MVVEGQIVAEEIVEICVESAARHLGRIEKLEGTGGGVARIGEERFPGSLALGIEAVEGFPWQHYLAADLEEVGVALALEFQWNRADGANVVGHVIAFLAVAAGHGAHQFAMLVDERYAGTVEFHFAYDFGLLAEKGVVDSAHPCVDIFHAVGVGKR